GGNSPTMRLPPPTTAGWLPTERAINEPPTANMTPIAGNTMPNHGHPIVWYSITRPKAAARRTSSHRSRLRRPPEADEPDGTCVTGDDTETSCVFSEAVLGAGTLCAA